MPGEAGAPGIEADRNRLMELEKSFRGLARQYAGRMRDVGPYQVEDLVQEILTKAMTALNQGKTPQRAHKAYYMTLARNHLISLARNSVRRAKKGFKIRSIDQDLLATSSAVAYDPNLDRQDALKSKRISLLGWLRDNPGKIPYGYEVLNGLLKTQADYGHIATALTIRTGEPWTVSRVESVVTQIKKTPIARDLCVELRYGRETSEQGR